jgi:hypothetical protein
LEKRGSASAGGGTDLSHMYNGSCLVGGACPNGNEFPGGTQALGGVDDANYDTTGNLTQTPPVGRYETTWTTCNVGNNYCGTGDTGANAKDEATGLTWSYLCDGEGCATWNTKTAEVLTAGCLPDGNCAYWDDPFVNADADSLYSWDNSGTPQNWYSGNNGMTAQELCQSKGANWHLPNQKQLMQAYIDGAYGNLDPVGVVRNYWSSTTYSYDASYAWYVGLSRGDSDFNVKTSNYSIRCVQE